MRTTVKKKSKEKNCTLVTTSRFYRVCCETRKFYKVRIASLKLIIITVFEYAVKRRQFISDELLANFRISFVSVFYVLYTLPYRLLRPLPSQTFTLYSIRVRDVTKIFSTHRINHLHHYSSETSTKIVFVGVGKNIWNVCYNIILLYTTN